MSMDIPRNQWVRCLTAVDQAELARAVHAITSRFKMEHRSLPESGLGLLQMRDAALNQNYFLGEFPVASAHVALIDDDGNEHRGAAYVMAEDDQQAIRLAVCDAVLAHGLPGVAALQKLLAAGQRRRAAEERERKGMLSSTKVAFNLLSDVGDDD